MIVDRFGNSQDKGAEPRYPALTAPARPRNRAREKGDNQLHRARVLEVRIHLPPADSPGLAQTGPLQVENRGFHAGVRRCVSGAVGRDAQALVENTRTGADISAGSYSSTQWC